MDERAEHPADGAKSGPRGAMRLRVRPPMLPGRLATRAQVARQLNRVAEGTVTIVVAPLGAGKTTLAAGWVAQSNGVVGWLSLDADDDRPSSLTRSLVAAVREAVGDPAVCAGALHLAVNDGQPEEIGALLVGEAAAAGLSAFVLDDGHELRDRDSWAVIAGMIAAGTTMDIVVLSRTPLPIDVVGRSRVVQLGAADLRFDPGDIREICEMTWGEEPSPERVAAIVEATHGWAALVRLAVARLGPESIDRTDLAPIDALPGWRAVVDGWVEALPMPVALMLMGAAIDDRSCDALARVVVPEDLRSLLPSSPLDEIGDLELVAATAGAPGWWRVHPLVRDALQTRFIAQLGPAGVAAARVRAAEWMSAHGMPREAVRLALSADANDLAGRVVVRFWLEALNTERMDELDALLAAIPARVTESWVDAGLARLWALWWKGEFEQVAVVGPALRMDALDGASTLALATDRVLAHLDAIDLIVAAPPGDAAAMTRRFESIASGLAIDDAYVRGLVAASAALRMAAYGDVDAALGFLAGRLSGTLAPTEAIRLHGIRAVVHELVRPDVAIEEAAIRQALALAEEAELPAAVTFAAGRLGWIALRQLDTRTARAAFAQARRQGQVSPMTAWRVERDGASLAAWLDGDDDGANAIAAEALRVAQHGRNLFLVEQARAHQARLWLGQRRFRLVDDWLASRLPDVELEAPGQHGWSGFTWMRACIGRVEMTGGRAREVREAEHAIAACTDAARRVHSASGLEMVALARALLLVACGDRRRAVAEAAPALDALAEREDILVIAELGTTALPLLRNRVEPGDDTAFFSRATAAVRKVEALASGKPTGRKPTRREIELLQEIARRGSARQVAERLSLSPRSVDRHLATLYLRMGVGSRSEAVDCARDLGFIA